MQQIAILGTGKMGKGIALNILRSGRNLTVWNRSKEKAKALIDAGAMWADTPAEAATNADAVIAMLADDIASKEVWLGTYGAMPQMKAGTFVIECSTLSADHVEALSSEASRRGLVYIDCPVTGIPEAAEKGQLTLLVGAATNDLEKCSALLQSFSAVIRHFGNIGTGTAYKLIINLMGAVQIAGLAEGIAMAHAAGLDMNTVTAAIEHSAAASPQVVRYTRRMAENTFAEHPGFTTSLRYKDAAYATALAQQMQVPARLGEVAKEWFGKAKELYPDRDEALVVRLMHPE
ncbi:MAG: NAD(P)-dependent oxidoreductase [Sphingobacteriales bacterium]|nr:NAD(P)-dependent oxidoreductase [Sphingobacteriales bacterium]OJY86450.1 MAG: dehydrogenase [Sphingobacteriales bacterium 44-15]